YTGNLIGGLGSGIYPISVSGNYNIRVLDLENDGINDYDSVATSSGNSIPNQGMNWDYGTHITQPFASTKDEQSFSVLPISNSYVNGNPGVSTRSSFPADSRNAVIASDKQVTGEVYSVAVGNDNIARKTVYDRSFDTGINQWIITPTTTISPTGAPGTGNEVLGICPSPIAFNSFDVFYRTTGF